MRGSHFKAIRQNIAFGFTAKISILVAPVKNNPSQPSLMLAQVFHPFWITILALQELLQPPIAYNKATAGRRERIASESREIQTLKLGRI